MKTKLLFLLCITAATIKGQIAVTEFMNRPNGLDANHEWVELYNYGTSSINLKNWSLSDEDTDSILISSTDLFMQPGTFLVLAANKDSFEMNWLGGIPSSVVVEYTGSYFLSNGTDEIVLKNAAGGVIWSLAYADDEVTGLGTYLTYGHDFSSSLTVWGSKASPGIVRNGNDPISSTLGYEDDSATTDAQAMISVMGDKGSPLSGNYAGGVSSVDEFQKEMLSIYPNPTADIINFSEVVSGQILDVTGKTVATFLNKKQVNVTDLKAGVFFVTIENKTYRLIKQ